MIEESGRVTLREGLRFVWRRVAPHRAALTVAAICLAGSALASILLSWSLAAIVQVLVAARDGQGSGPPVADLSRLGLTFAALALLEVLLSRGADALQLRLRPQMRQEATADLYRHLQGHSHRYFSDHFAGALSQRISEAAQGSAQLIWSCLSELWPLAIVLLMALGFLTRASAALGAFFALWAVVFLGVSILLGRRVHPLARRSAEARSRASGQLVDAIANQQSVRLFARAGHEEARLDQVHQTERALILRANLETERVRWFQYGAAAALKVGVIGIGLWQWRAGALAISDFVLASTLAFVVINEARNFGRRIQDTLEALNNLRNGLSAILREHEVADPESPVPARFTEPSIAFENVRFGHAPDALLFDALDIRIPAGQRVGLVGPSGSGKSTFVNLLMRQFDPWSGAVRIAGFDLKTLSQACLREQITFVPQDTQLFHRSLMENIRYGDLSATDEAVRDAARRAGAADFIEALPQGYDALVGERGVKLSGGERQRIALARGLLKRAPVLILDEATSSLDSINEQAILQTLEAPELAGCTVIVIAHRLSTVSHLDRILVFDRGRIVEDGSPEALKAHRGAYWRLWSRQVDGFLSRGLPALGEGASTGQN